MTQTIPGVVKNGVVIPGNVLPEGARVEIHVLPELQIPPELQEELAAWQQASANALAMVERMAEEDQTNATR